MSSAAAVSAWLEEERGNSVSGRYTHGQNVIMLPNSYTFIMQYKTKNAHFSTTKTTTFILYPKHQCLRHHLLLSQNFFILFQFPFDFS
jgi:hypothetical protein